MFRDIVVPLDGSRFAERALRLAEWIATEDRARIHLIRVHQSPGPADQDSTVRAADQRYLEPLASELRDHVAEVRIAVLDGSPALAIADYADRVDADLVVMTTHGRTGDARRRLGSVAAVVAHHARCMVIFVRGEATAERESEPFNRVLIAVDGAECREDVEAIALRLGTHGHAAFRILHTLPAVQAREPGVATAQTETHLGHLSRERATAEGNISCIARRLRAAGLRAETLIGVAQSPEDTILEAASQDAVDLIVVAPAMSPARQR
jgi:nucleotide-binding universal stress UspA family protein